MLTSRKHPRVLEWAELNARPRSDAAIAEGPHLALEALRDAEATVLLITDEFAAAAEGAKIVALSRARGVELALMTAAVYAKISALCQPEGVAVVFRPRQFSLPEIFSRRRLLVAAGVQDPGNAGALARVAEAAGFDGCVFTGGVNPLKEKFLRAAMGSAFRLPCLKSETSAVLAAARANNLPLFVAAATGATDYRRVEFPARYAVVVGGEGQGVPPEIRAAAAAVIQIPLTPPVESLNVAVAAGVLLFQGAR
ncbi:tRNA/rRNA methyltransferase SpoU [Planctomycetales bacterium]|nr:tRNA/rRNA methyltransferase SpoU [Planctomycetales bacterium]